MPGTGTETKREKLTAVQWLSEIEDGLEYRKRYGKENAWASIENTFYSVDQEDRRAAGPNLIASTGDSMLSSLSMTNPYMNVKPEQEAYVESAPLVESIDNWLIKKLKLTDAGERAMLHAYLWGNGMFKIGYDSQFGYESKFDIGGVAQPMGLTLTQFKKGNLIESGIVDPGMPWVCAVPPHDIVVPWGTVDFDDAPWVAHRVVRHIDDIMADKKYKHPKDLKPQMSMEDFMRSYTTQKKIYRTSRDRTSAENMKGAQYVEMYEIHIKRERRIKVVATGYRKFLRDDVNELQIDGLPFVPLSFTLRARAYWTTSDAYYLRNAQAEMDDIALQAATQRRLTKLKFLYEDGAIDQDSLEDILTDETGIGIKVNAGSSVKDSIGFMHNENQSSIYQDAEIIRKNAREVTGLSRNQAGEFESTGRRTAKEAGIVDRASLTRMGRKQNALRKAYTEVLGKINQMIFKFWTRERVIEYLGPENASKWIAYTGEMIKGEYMYDLVFSDEILDTQGNDENESLQLYVQLSQDPSVNQEELRDWLVKAHKDPKFKKMFTVQQQQPGQQEKQNATLPV